MLTAQEYFQSQLLINMTFSLGHIRWDYKPPQFVNSIYKLI